MEQTKKILIEMLIIGLNTVDNKIIEELYNLCNDYNELGMKYIANEIKGLSDSLSEKLRNNKNDNSLIVEKYLLIIEFIKALEIEMS